MFTVMVMVARRRARAMMFSSSRLGLNGSGAGDNDNDCEGDDFSECNFFHGFTSFFDVLGTDLPKRGNDFHCLHQLICG